MKPIPGIEIFSDQWFHLHASEVPHDLLPMVRGICQSYNLGNTDDPAIVARLILQGAQMAIGKERNFGTVKAKPTGIYIASDGSVRLLLLPESNMIRYSGG